MTQFVVALVVAVIAGLCGYNEAGKIEQRFRVGPWDLSPPVCGLSCFAGALAVGLVVPVVALTAVVVFVGYRGATRYESQNGNRFGGLASLAWGGVSGALVLIGSLVTSTFVMGTVCLELGLVITLLLVVAERDELLRENKALVAEKSALIAEKKTSRTEGPTQPASASKGSSAYSNAIASALRGELIRPSSRRIVPQRDPAASTWSSSFAGPPVPGDEPNTYDLMPRSARRPQPGVGGNDLLPGDR